MDPARLQQIGWIRLLVTTADVYPASYCGWTTFSPRASMGFRPLPPQRLPDISRSHAGPHTRFGKRRVTVLPSPAILLQLPRWDLLSVRCGQAAFTDKVG
jgi:hypothetical protein